MKGLFNIKLKIESWESQKWDMSHFFNAFLDEYMAMLNGMLCQIYDFANKEDQEHLDSNLLTLKSLKEQFKDDYAYVVAKYVNPKPKNDIRKDIDEEFERIRKFRLDFKDREDKKLSHEEQVARIDTHISFIIYSIKYDMDCIRESHDLKNYEELCKRVHDKKSQLIAEARELGVYSDLADRFDEIDGNLSIDKTKLKEFHELPSIDFKANTIYEKDKK